MTFTSLLEEFFHFRLAFLLEDRGWILGAEGSALLADQGDTAGRAAELNILLLLLAVAMVMLPLKGDRPAKE